MKTTTMMNDVLSWYAIVFARSQSSYGSLSDSCRCIEKMKKSDDNE